MSEVPDRSSDPTLVELLRRLEPAYEPELVYLFGSRARGEGGPDSDYDLLLVVANDAPPERKRSRLAYEVLRGTGVAADVIVWTRRDFDPRLGVVTSLPATVVREGRLLLERITHAPTIFGGKPIIRGRRLAVEHVLGMLAAGDSVDTVLAGYPWLQREDLQACLAYDQAGRIK